MTNGANQLQGKRILLVEDEYLVAQVVIDYLEETGAEVVGPFGRVDDALTHIANHHSMIDAAVLDVNLHGQKSYPVADALAANNVRFVFTTGYAGETLDSRYQHFTRCEKPFSKEVLIETLCRACATLKGAKQS